METDRKQEIIALAYTLLQYLGFTRFPIQLEALTDACINKLGIQVATYSQYAAFRKSSIFDVARSLNSFDAVTQVGAGQALILYNDGYSQMAHRQRFTLAHEIGHVALKHYLIKQAHLKKHLPVPKKIRAELETEANFFAAHFLAPAEVVVALASLYPYCSKYSVYALLREAFGLSKDASYVRLEQLSDPSCAVLLDWDQINPYRPYLKSFADLFDVDFMDALTDRHRADYDHTRKMHYMRDSGTFVAPPVPVPRTAPVVSKVLEKVRPDIRR